jgi:predicted dehydrogenase
MWTLAPHDISILNYLFGATPVRVRARGHIYVHRQVASRTAEVCFAELDYPGDRNAHLHLSWLDPQKRRDMVIVGSERMLVYDDVNPEGHIRVYDKKAEAEFQGEMTDFADFTTRLRAGDLTVPNIRLSEPLAVEIDHFVSRVRDGTPPLTDGWHATEVVAVMEALAQSMERDGAPVDVDYPRRDRARTAV